MPVTIRCPSCSKPLVVPETLLGKTVRCGGCQATFAAQAPEPAPPQAIATEPRPLPAAVPLEPAPAPARPRTAPAKRAASGLVKPFSFKAAVQNDPEKLLKGFFECRVSEDGLELKQKKLGTLLVPVGTRAEYVGSNRFSVEIEDRTVVFAIAEWNLYYQSLARDLCGFLQGEEPAPERDDYVIPAYLYVLCFLPIGIPIITLGGALWGALGGGLVAACLGIIRQEKLSITLRVLSCLGLTAVGYGILGMVLWMKLADKRAAENPHPPPPNFHEDEPVDVVPPPRDQPLPLGQGELRRFRTKAGLVWHVRFSPDQQTLATLGKTGICELWDRNTGNPQGQSFQAAQPDYMNWLTFSPERGRYLVAWSGQPQLDLRDGTTGIIILPRMDMVGGGSAYASCEFFPDGQTLVACADEKIRFWTIPDCQPTNKFAHVKSQGEAAFFTALVTRDGKNLITGGKNNKGRLDQVWDLTADTPQRPLKSFSREKTNGRTTLTPDGKLAVLMDTRLIEVVDWEQDKAVLLKEAPVQADFSGYTFTHDSKTLVTGHADGMVRFWQVPSGKEMGSFKARQRGAASVTGLAVSNDGLLLSTAIGDEVSLWNLNEVLPVKN